MTQYDRQALLQLKQGKLPFQKVHEMLSKHKDPNRFLDMLAILQELVPWKDRILFPLSEHLYIVEKEDKSRVIKCDCGHEFCEASENWKLYALVYVRDTQEKIDEIYPAKMGCDANWMQLREYFCPGCAAQLDVEALPPGYPILHDFQPDIDLFYEKWLGMPLAASKNA